MGYAQRAARAWAGLATAVAGLSVVAVFGLAAPAAADVSFDSEQGQRTGGARVAFRVTNESPTASITKVEVRLPDDVRIPEIYPIAVADWAPSITMTKVDGNAANDIPSAVVWVTMPGREIKPGASSVLPLAMGPMPDREAVYLDVIQTRSDGSTVTWAGVDVAAAGAQHPAFRLELVPLEPGQVPANHHGGAAASGAAQTDVAADPAAESPESAEGSGTVRLALVLLLIAALTAFALYWQRRRRPSGADLDGAEATDDAVPAARVPAQRRNGAPPKRTAAATRTPAPAAAGPATGVQAKAAPATAAQAKAVPATGAQAKVARATGAQAKVARATGAQAKAAPAKATPAAEAPAQAAPAGAEEVSEPALVAAPGDNPTPVVQRRSVVRATTAKKAAERRRTVARKSTGGTATATMAGRRENASSRAGDTEGDNA